MSSTPASPDNARPSTACNRPGCCDAAARREFLKLSGLSAASLAIGGGLTSIAGPFEPADVVDHHVPADKKLDAGWVQALFERGQPTCYAGDDLKFIAMPVGGICAGQVYLTGDGRLTYWSIHNQTNFTGYGATNYDVPTKPTAALVQGFAIQAKWSGKTVIKPLDRTGFPKVSFCGQYPIGIVKYASEELPVAVTLEAFSPFVPLHSADSSLPAIVLQYTLHNTGATPVETTLAGWLENGVCWHSGEVLSGARINQALTDRNLAMIVNTAKAMPPKTAHRPAMVLASFEGTDYNQWKADGEAFGKAPAHGTLKGQQPVSGFVGKGLVNTFLAGDKPQGKLTSPPFTIERNYLCFKIGGGNHAKQTCVNLLVDGKTVRTATGQNKEQLAWQTWNVKDLAGKSATIEIVDAASGPWGHVNVDQIELRDTPPAGFSGPLEKQADFGSMGLAILGSEGSTILHPALPTSEIAAAAVTANPTHQPSPQERDFGQPLVGGLNCTVTLAPGEKRTLSFVVAWHFGLRPEHGNQYATRFADATAVVRYVAEHLEKLGQQTRLWRDTWYDSSLPYWLLDRLFSTVSILATGTCQRWANGRFWAWEGVGCCHGTCAHVWNYEHAMARLFPDLERSVREMQDFDAGFVAESGAVMFRGENWKMWAGDSQGGTVLKAYREHLCAPNAEFLRRNWPKIRKVTEFLIQQDGDGDGLIEGSQHNTYDINFFGANTMVGSLYLGALRAAEAMARELGETEFADRCHALAEAGGRNSVDKLFNGEYFIQQVDLSAHPKHQYGQGCLADQLFGQGWAHQVALGYLYPRDKVLSALKAIWKYDWAPNIGPQNEAHPPQRWFARPGEAGLFVCTWPKTKHLGPDSVLYRDEVWTGIEYQVAGHMVWEGMLTEALAICRAIHERYHPARRNPYNEIECGDHYSRAMASHGVFLALCGFDYHGPRRHLGFAPKLAPDNFRAAFTAAEGWGTLSQQRDKQSQTNQVQLRWGRLPLASLALELPEGRRAGRVQATAAGRPLAAIPQTAGRTLTLRFTEICLAAGENLAVVVELA